MFCLSNTIKGLALMMMMASGICIRAALAQEANAAVRDSNVPAMRAIFFIDDWMLDSRRDVDRVFPAPQPMSLIGAEDLGLSTIIYDPEVKRLRAWTKMPDATTAILYESEDGVKWHATEHTRDIYPAQNFFEQTWFYDPWDSDQNHRHKMVSYPYKKNHWGGDRGVIETSPDGITWTLQPEWVWESPGTYGSDTSNNMFYNPFLHEYAVICRKYHIDRRIAMVTSRDLKNWSRPVMLMIPDPMDPPLTQFYGMGAFLYRDEVFIGFPQFYRVPNDEERRGGSSAFYKMSGKIHSELAYSYDGYAWNRTTRQPVIPSIEPGEYGGGTLFVRAMVQRPADGRILVYSRGCLRLHDLDRDKTGKPRPLPEKYDGKMNHLLLHTWRADGFACLESFSNTAMIRTRYLVPHSPELTLNLQIPFGTARVQVVDAKNCPVPGFTFDDCEPLRGDDIRMPVRWREHRDLTAVMDGKRIALEIRFSSGRLYAINLHCSPWYTTSLKPIPRP